MLITIKIIKINEEVYVISILIILYSYDKIENKRFCFNDQSFSQINNFALPFTSD